MNTGEIIIILAILAGFGSLGYFLNLKLSGKKEESPELKVVTEWMKQMQNSFETRLDKSATELNQRLDRAAQIIGSLQKELGSVNEFNRSMREILAAPKTRGNFGELVLEELLKQYLPAPNYKMQFKFKNGETVDAVILLDGKVLCIDSKFPLENFKAIYSAEDEAGRTASEKSFVRDVKKHIDDIAKKYILPQENTYDLALMYVPSEAVYYEILRNDSVLEYARSKRVHLVSPQAMYYQIYVFAQALRGQKVSAIAQEVLKSFSAIKQDTIKFGEALGILSRHVTNAKAQIDNVNSSYLKLNEKVDRAAELQGVEVVAEALPEKVVEVVRDQPMIQ